MSHKTVTDVECHGGWQHEVGSVISMSWVKEKEDDKLLEFLILQGNSQNRNMVYFRMKYSLPSCLTLAINHTTN